MLTRTRNAYLADKEEVLIPHTGLLEEIASIMKQENYIMDYSVSTNDNNFKDLKIKLLYVSGKPAINKVRRISKPGVRVYIKAHQIIPVLSGLGIAIISTSKGIMTNIQAKKQNLGGEVLCELW